MKLARENFRILSRGLRRRCPQCGQRPLFIKGWQLYETCAHCGLDIRHRESDTWAIMYFSTAFLTGLFLLPMFWITPTHPWLFRILIVLAALLVYFFTASTRKGFAIAFDYLIELRWNNERGLKFKDH